MTAKKIAVIGAGIFGVTAALELAKEHKVVIFEKENDIFTQATYVNQYRHHMGYHYPRSLETVTECKRAKNDFESVFGKAIAPQFPYFYGIAKNGSKTTASAYLNFCKSQKLPFEIIFPTKKYLNRNKVELAIRVPETVYDFQTLKRIAIKKIDNCQNIELKLKTLVIGGKIDKNGNKMIDIIGGSNQDSFGFDYIVNATYSNYNLLCQAFGFPSKKLQFELVELLVIKLPLPEKIGVTVMDGPFTCILPIGHTGYYSLGHVEASVHKREIAGGVNAEVVKKWGKVRSARDKITKDSQEFLPILSQATHIKSLYVIRIVNPENELDDGRPTEITDHGLGFFSIFAGKIITCVTTAKQLSKLILTDQYRN